jgi:hypothetical protein
LFAAMVTILRGQGSPYAVIKVSDQELAAVNLKRAHFHGE